MQLSERAMLCVLRRGMWGGSMHDQQVTEETAEAHKADLKEAGRYSKQLISRKALKLIAGKMSVARETHRVLTLPWDDDGTRILSARGYMHYMEAMRLCRHGAEAAVKNFLKEYPTHIQAAKLTLGNMFNQDDYPDVKQLEKKFYIDTEIKPIPEAKDFRTKLSDDTVKAITKDIERRTNERVEAAVNDCFERIAKVTGKMAERLNEYEPKQGEEKAKGAFRDSLVFNVKELADLLPSLNITDDPRLDELASELNKQLVQYSPEVLKTDAKARKQTARNAEKLFKKVSAYLA